MFAVYILIHQRQWIVLFRFQFLTTCSPIYLFVFYSKIQSWVESKVWKKLCYSQIRSLSFQKSLIGEIVKWNNLIRS